MNEFRNLEPNMRALALIGHFLQSWAMVEHQLNNAITTALDLETLPGLIVVKNVQLRDKVHIAKTAIQMSLIPPADKLEFKKLIEQISKFSMKRNIVAHEIFLASDKGDGVKFLITKANGDLKFPDESWGLAEFQSYFEKMNEFCLRLIALVEALKNSREHASNFEHPSALPTAGLGGASLLNLLLHQPQSSPDSSPPEASDQTED
jgi:hypothetical protein